VTSALTFDQRKCSLLAEHAYLATSR
jgi:hypothetical protein